MLVKSAMMEVISGRWTAAGPGSGSDMGTSASLSQLLHLEVAAMEVAVVAVEMMPMR